MLLGQDVAIDVGLCRQQGRNRHDQAHRLHEAEPLEVSEMFGIFGHLAVNFYPVTGQR